MHTNDENNMTRDSFIHTTNITQRHGDGDEAQDNNNKQTRKGGGRGGGRRGVGGLSSYLAVSLYKESVMGGKKVIKIIIRLIPIMSTKNCQPMQGNRRQDHVTAPAMCKQRPVSLSKATPPTTTTPINSIFASITNVIQDF